MQPNNQNQNHIPAQQLRYGPIPQPYNNQMQFPEYNQKQQHAEISLLVREQTAQALQTLKEDERLQQNREARQNRENRNAQDLHLQNSLDGQKEIETANSRSRKISKATTYAGIANIPYYSSYYNPQATLDRQARYAAKWKDFNTRATDVKLDSEFSNIEQARRYMGRVSSSHSSPQNKYTAFDPGFKSTASDMFYGRRHMSPEQWAHFREFGITERLGGGLLGSAVQSGLNVAAPVTATLGTAMPMMAAASLGNRMALNARRAKTQIQQKEQLGATGKAASLMNGLNSVKMAALATTGTLGFGMSQLPGMAMSGKAAALMGVTKGLTGKIGATALNGVGATGLAAGVTAPVIAGALTLALPSIAGAILNAKADNKRKKIRGGKESTSSLEKKTSRSRGLSSIISQLTSANELSAADQIKIELLKMIESHTSPISIIASATKYTEDQRTKDVNASTDEYRHTINRDKIEANEDPGIFQKTAKVSSYGFDRSVIGLQQLLARFPIQQLMTLILEGKGRGTVINEVDEMAFNRKLEYNRPQRLQKLSRETGLSLPHLKLLTTPSYTLLGGSESPEAKMITLQSGIFDLLRYQFKQGVEKSENTDISEPIFSPKDFGFWKNIPILGQALEGLQATAKFMWSPIKTITDPIKSLTNKAITSAKRFVLGDELTEHKKDPNILKKKLGLIKSIDEKKDLFFTIGLPNKLDEISTANLEEVNLLTSIDKNIQELVRIKGGTVTSTAESASRKIYDDISGEYYNQKSYDKLQELRKAKYTAEQNKMLDSTYGRRLKLVSKIQKLTPTKEVISGISGGLRGFRDELATLNDSERNPSRRLGNIGKSILSGLGKGIVDFRTTRTSRQSGVFDDPYKIGNIKTAEEIFGENEKAKLVAPINIKQNQSSSTGLSPDRIAQKLIREIRKFKKSTIQTLDLFRSKNETQLDIIANKLDNISNQTTLDLFRSKNETQLDIIANKLDNISNQTTLDLFRSKNETQLDIIANKLDNIKNPTPDLGEDQLNPPTPQDNIIDLIGIVKKNNITLDLFKIRNEAQLAELIKLSNSNKISIPKDVNVSDDYTSDIINPSPVISRLASKSKTPDDYNSDIINTPPPIITRMPKTPDDYVSDIINTPPPIITRMPKTPDDYNSNQNDIKSILNIVSIIPKLISNLSSQTSDDPKDPKSNGIKLSQIPINQDPIDLIGQNIQTSSKLDDPNDPKPTRAKLLQLPNIKQDAPDMVGQNNQSKIEDLERFKLRKLKLNKQRFRFHKLHKEEDWDSTEFKRGINRLDSLKPGDSREVITPKKGAVYHLHDGEVVSKPTTGLGHSSVTNELRELKDTQRENKEVQEIDSTLTYHKSFESFTGDLDTRLSDAYEQLKLIAERSLQNKDVFSGLAGLFSGGGLLKSLLSGGALAAITGALVPALTTSITAALAAAFIKSKSSPMSADLKVGSSILNGLSRLLKPITSGISGILGRLSGGTGKFLSEKAAGIGSSIAKKALPFGAAIGKKVIPFAKGIIESGTGLVKNSTVGKATIAGVAAAKNTKVGKIATSIGETALEYGGKATTAIKSSGVGKFAIDAAKSVGGIIPGSGNVIKATVKGTGKVGAKLIPGIGVGVGTGLAIKRVLHGDYTGASAEFASGALSLVPIFTLGLGSVASIAAQVAIEGWLIYHDIQLAKKTGVVSPELEQQGKDSLEALKKVCSKDVQILIGNDFGKFTELKKANKIVLDKTLDLWVTPNETKVPSEKAKSDYKGVLGEFKEETMTPTPPELGKPPKKLPIDRNSEEWKALPFIEKLKSRAEEAYKSPIIKSTVDTAKSIGTKIANSDTAQAIVNSAPAQAISNSTPINAIKESLGGETSYAIQTPLGPNLEQAFKSQIRSHEGNWATSYPDANGRSIGVGHFILKGEHFKEPISQDQIDVLFAKDFQTAVNEARRIEEFNMLEGDGVRQGALIDMVFNMGGGGVRGFKEMRKGIREKNWKYAAAEILNSDYGRGPTKNRARTIAKQMLTGDPKYIVHARTGAYYKPYPINRRHMFDGDYDSIPAEIHPNEAIVPLDSSQFQNIFGDLLQKSFTEHNQSRVIEQNSYSQENSNIVIGRLSTAIYTFSDEIAKLRNVNMNIDSQSTVGKIDPVEMTNAVHVPKYEETITGKMDLRKQAQVNIPPQAPPPAFSSPGVDQGTVNTHNLRSINGFAENMIDSIFKNTIISIESGITSFAMGQSPFQILR